MLDNIRGMLQNPNSNADIRRYLDDVFGMVQRNRQNLEDCTAANELQQRQLEQCQLRVAALEKQNQSNLSIVVKGCQ